MFTAFEFISFINPPFGNKIVANRGKIFKTIFLNYNCNVKINYGIDCGACTWQMRLHKA